MKINELTENGHLDSGYKFNSQNLNVARDDCQREIEDAMQKEGKAFSIQKFIRKKGGFYDYKCCKEHNK